MARSRAPRLGDPVDGPVADRLVAVERERAALLGRQPSREQPHQGPGVADVDRPLGLVRLTQAGPPHDDLLAPHLDQRPKRLHRRERGSRVRRVEVVLDAHRLGGHRAKQRRAMGDRLVGRGTQLARESACRLETHVLTLVCPVRPQARATGNPRSAISCTARRECSSPAIQSATTP
jgi:hypothetical protein